MSIRTFARNASIVSGFLLTSLLAATPGHAVDGVREINQACFSSCRIIDEPGSYVLTSDIELSGVGNAIFVTASDVTIDLNGFEIRGTTTCTGSTGETLSCTPTSTGEAYGIRAVGLNTVVKNGRIRGMANRGITCGDGCRIENVELVENGNGGARVTDGGIVQNCIVRRNGGIGIGWGGSGGMRYEGNTLIENASYGLSSGGYSVITGNVARRNGDTGIHANPGSTVIGNTSSHNRGSGIRAYGGLVRENVVMHNTNEGLELNISDTLYSDNVVDQNGATVSGGTQSGVNWCDADTICP